MTDHEHSRYYYYSTRDFSDCFCRCNYDYRHYYDYVNHDVVIIIRIVTMFVTVVNTITHIGIVIISVTF